MGILGYAKKKWQEHEVARITGATKRRKQRKEIQQAVQEAAFKERKKSAIKKAIAYEKGGGFLGAAARGLDTLTKPPKGGKKKGRGKDPFDFRL